MAGLLYILCDYVDIITCRCFEINSKETSLIQSADPCDKACYTCCAFIWTPCICACFITLGPCMCCVANCEKFCARNDCAQDECVSDTVTSVK